MKKIFSFILFLFTIGSYSQEYIITTRSAVYETMLTTRESVVKNLENEIALRRYYNSLLVIKDDAGNDTCRLFTAHEKTFLAYLTGDYRSILERIKSGNDLHQSLRFAKCNNNGNCPCANEYIYDSLFVRSVDLLAEKERSIREKIEKDHSLSSEEKKLLAIHLKSCVAYCRLENFDVEKMKTEADTFLIHAKDPSFRKYVPAYIYPSYKTSLLGFGAGFHLGYNAMLGETGNYFRGFVGQQANVEISVKKIYFKSDFMFSSGKKLKQGFTWNGFDFTTDSVAFMMGFQLFGGYAVADNERIKVTPFAGITNASFSLSGNSRNMVFATSYAGGVDVDYKFFLYRFYNDYQDLFSNPYNKSCWFLRLRLAYYHLPAEDSRFSGAGLFIGAGVGFHINRAKKVEQNE